MNTKVYNFKVGKIYKNPDFDKGVKIMDVNGLTGETLEEKKVYNFDKDWDEGILINDESLRSCLICNNSSSTCNVDTNKFKLQTAFKWGVLFCGTILNTDTGELDENQIFEITDLESGIKRKKKAIRNFANFYEPLYQERKVSCFFFTFTQANKTAHEFATTLNAIKKRFIKANNPILGYIWVSEVSNNGHWHYHLAVATKRVKWKAIPKYAKIDDIWGRRTQIQFIKKSIGAYLGKYIGKDNIGRMIDYRAYGKSRNFIEPLPF